MAGALAARARAARTRTRALSARSAHYAPSHDLECFFAPLVGLDRVPHRHRVLALLGRSFVVRHGRDSFCFLCIFFRVDNTAKILAREKKIAARKNGDFQKCCPYGNYSAVRAMTKLVWGSGSCQARKERD